MCNQRDLEVQSWSILKYVCPLKQKPDLPDPSGPLSEQIPWTAITSANVKVLEALKECGEEKKEIPRTILVVDAFPEV